jgi:HD-like signal output (HDOD) protein
MQINPEIMQNSATCSPCSLDRTLVIQLADSLSACGHVIGRLNQLLRSPYCNLEEVASVMRSDPALSARVVRVANSAFFGIKTRVRSLEEALQRVGLREVFRIVSTAALQQLSPTQLRAYNISGQTFLKASVFSATVSQLLAERAGLDPHSAYLAGLMRPLGVLVLNKHGVMRFDNVEQLAAESDTTTTLESWERQYFGFSHAEASAYILDHWQFPESLTCSVSCYNRDTDVDPLATILHAAGALAVTSHATVHPRDHDHTLRRDWLGQLGIPASALPQISLTALRAARQLDDSM